MGYIVAIGGKDLQITELLNQYIIKIFRKEYTNVLLLGQEISVPEKMERYIRLSIS